MDDLLCSLLWVQMGSTLSGVLCTTDGLDTSIGLCESGAICNSGCYCDRTYETKSFVSLISGLPECYLACGVCILICVYAQLMLQK